MPGIEIGAPLPTDQSEILPVSPKISLWRPFLNQEKKACREITEIREDVERAFNSILHSVMRRPSSKARASFADRKLYIWLSAMVAHNPSQDERSSREPGVFRLLSHPKVPPESFPLAWNSASGKARGDLKLENDRKGEGSVLLLAAFPILMEPPEAACPVSKGRDALSVFGPKK